MQYKILIHQFAEVKAVLPPFPLHSFGPCSDAGGGCAASKGLRCLRAQPGAGDPGREPSLGPALALPRAGLGWAGLCAGSGPAARRGCSAGAAGDARPGMLRCPSRSGPPALSLRVPSCSGQVPLAAFPWLLRDVVGSRWELP